MKKHILAVISGLFICCAFGFAGENESNTATVKKVYTEVANKGNIAMIDEVFADDFIEHQTIPDGMNGKQAVKNWFTMLHTGMPDVKFTIIDMVSHSDKVWAYYSMTGTHSGEFMGMPASGKKVDVKGVDIIQLKDGKIIAHWGVSEELSMMQQLGVIPMPGQSAEK